MKTKLKSKDRLKDFCQCVSCKGAITQTRKDTINLTLLEAEAYRNWGIAGAIAKPVKKLKITQDKNYMIRVLNQIKK